MISRDAPACAQLVGELGTHAAGLAAADLQNEDAAETAFAYAASAWAESMRSSPLQEEALGASAMAGYTR